jgi:CDP-diacylglycerol--serine O-phosphatidyltransferase
VPRTLWGRRRTTDSPRPAGRWAGRLRRSGSLARQVLLVRVGRRRGRQSGTAVLDLPGGELHLAGQPLARIGVRPRRFNPPPFRIPGRTPRLGPTAPFQAAAGADLFGPGVIPPDVVPAGVALPDVALPGDGPAGEEISPVSAEPVRTGSPRPIPLLPGAQTPARRIRFALVNACTIGSLGLGVAAILLSMHGDVRWAALCLVACVSLDGLDGALARRLGVTSPFGAQLDSMADMCSFGIAAPVVVYTRLHGSASAVLVGAACALVAACAAIRLARFNVSPKDGRFFCGVPTTTVAAVLGLAMLIGLRPSGVVSVAALSVLALAMISGFPYAKLGRVAKLPPWLWLAPGVGALLDYRITFAALVALYLASGPVLWLKARSR